MNKKELKHLIKESIKNILIEGIVTEYDITLDEESTKKVNWYPLDWFSVPDAEDPMFAGTFEATSWRPTRKSYYGRSTGILYNLDNFDKHLLTSNNIHPTSDERIYRYETMTTRAGKITPFVKINIKTGLIYFPKKMEDETIEFDTKGVKPIYINLVKEKLKEEIKPLSSRPKNKKIEIDLSGPDGNAFVLMGYTKKFAKDLGWTSEEITDLLRDMQSADYNHLIELFDANFGEYVTLYQ